MTPLVTVLMPTLNAQEYLSDALDSLASQTFQDFKVLVVDGGSTDDTLAIARSYDRVEVLSCGRGGLGTSLQIGLGKAETPFAARMDADDVAVPQRLEIQIGEFRNPELAIVGGQIDLLIGSTVCRAQPFPPSPRPNSTGASGGFPGVLSPHGHVPHRPSAPPARLLNRGSR